MTQKDLKTLPKWAQDEISDLRRENTNLRAISSILDTNTWMNVGAGLGSHEIWIFTNNTPKKIATIKEGDMLVLGRPKS